MPDAPPPRLRLSDLSRSFGETVALDGLSLALAAGESVALLGPAGAGKSTALALVAGFLRPDRGGVALDGSPLRGAPHRRNLTALFAAPQLLAHLTVARNVALARGATAEMLDLLRLGPLAGRPAGGLAPAEAHRVALARALARRPAVLLLDDPFAGLDRAERDGLLATLEGLRTRLGLTLLHATRDPGAAMALADRIAVLAGGRLRQCAAPRALYEAPADALVARLLGEDNHLPGLVEAVEDDIARVRLACGPVVEAQAGELAAGRRCVVSIRPERIAVAAVSAAEMGEGAVPATLRDVAFRGDHVRLVVGVGNGDDEVVVHRPAIAPLAGLVPGAALALAWQPHHACTFRPEAGT